MHSSPAIGHSGFYKTYESAKRSFFWEGMKIDICEFVASYDICQRNKGETTKTLGALQQLPIPTQIWTGIYMDFIVGIPKAGNKSVIMVIVDHLIVIFVHYHIHSLLVQLLKSSWIKFSSYMACLIQLSQTGTPPSPTNFGKSYLEFSVLS